MFNIRFGTLALVATVFSMLNFARAEVTKSPQPTVFFTMVQAKQCPPGEVAVLVHSSWDPAYKDVFLKKPVKTLRCVPFKGEPIAAQGQRVRLMLSNNTLVALPLEESTP